MKYGKKNPVRGIEDNKILTLWQKSFIREFCASELNDYFKLSGGTALSAFYLEHRLSNDLDFFSAERISVYETENFLKRVQFVKQIHYTKIFDRQLFVLVLEDDSTLKVEFTYFPFMNLKSPNRIASLWIDSFEDIVVNKLCTIADRNEIKDYVDVYAALKDMPDSFEDYWIAAENKCEISGIRHILESRLLQIPAGVDELLLIKKNDSLNDMKLFFSNFVRERVRAKLNKYDTDE